MATTITGGNRWSGAKARRLMIGRSLLASTALMPVALALLPHFASAAPQGGMPAAGNVTIVNRPHGVTVTQTSNRAIVNWQSFSVGAKEVARFNLPSSLSAILNRVTGSDPSLIAGRLSSNGQVYLINPNGIVVGPNGRVNTAAFVASTLNVPDAAFTRGGGMTFMGDSGAGIQVLGNIKAASGDVVLVAAVVDNQGRIAAPNGQAILGAGGQFYYVPDGQSDIVIAASPGSGAASLSNSGAIAAANVQLKAAGNPYALAVNNSGLISATAVRHVGGRVVLDGGAGDTVDSGAIVARSADKGGVVTVTGRQVTLTGSALIEASGNAGGGTVNIGGGARGADPAVANAKSTTVAAGASLRANAMDRGDGGSVVVWSTGYTDYAGSISAKGGPNGGNGGSAEVSGHTLDYRGLVDLTAPRGTIGSVLLDPATLSICELCATTPDSILTTLNTANALISATDSLTVDSPIVGPQLNRLTLDAPNITVNASISLPNGLLAFTDTTQPSGGTLSSVASATITAKQIDIGGNFDATSLAGPVSTPALNLFQDGVSATITNAANSIGSFFSGQGNFYTGNIAVSSSSAMTVSGITATGGSVTLVAGGNLTMQSGTALTVSGATTLASTGGTFVNDAGTGLIAGTSRALLYASTDAGFNDGGLGYTQFNPVAFGSDPMPGLSTVTYFARSTTLPALMITANNAARYYGSANPTFTDVFSGGSAADLVVAEQLGVSGGPAVNVGAYGIVPSGAVSSTRAVSFINGTLTIDPAPLTITANSASRTYGASNPTFSASYSGLVNGDKSSVVTGLGITSAATSASNVGDYAIVPAGGSASNYTILNANGTLTVDPAALTITANSTSRTYGANNPTFTASYSGLLNGDKASVVSGLSLTTTATSGSNVGGYTITASGGAASNYTISDVNGTLTVDPAALTVTANSPSRTYGANNPTFSASYSGLVNGDTSSVVTGLGITSAATSASNVGSYAIVPAGGSAANYTITNVNGTLTVDPAALTITANSPSRTYGANNPTFSASYSGLVNGDTSSVVSGLGITSAATSASNVGDYAIVPAGGSAANYTITNVNGTLTVDPAALTITANNMSRTYGANNPTFTATFSGLVNGDKSSVVSGLSLNTTATSGSNVGGYAIAASGGTASNYTITDVNGTLTVDPAALIITANNTSRTYGANNPTFAASYAGLVNGDSSLVVSRLGLTTTATNASNVGAYAITASGGTASNYTISNVNGTLTIDPAALTITANNAARTYGAGNPSFAASYSGLVNGDTSSVVSGLSLSTAATSKSTVGSYDIVPAGSNASNYTITNTNGILTVNPAALTITANNASRAYGVSNPAFTASYSGLLNGDKASVVSRLSLATAATSASSVGTYAITASGGSASNYTITDINGTLTVNPAALTITANNASRTYGTSNPAFTAAYSGFVNGDTSSVVSGLGLTTTATTKSSVGTYAIVPSGGASPNYKISYVNGAMTINQAALSIVANDATRVTGVANPNFTATYSGLLNGDSASVVSGLGFGTLANASSAAGKYTITPSGAVAANYKITFGPGTLTVTQPTTLSTLPIVLPSKTTTTPAGAIAPTTVDSTTGVVTFDIGNVTLSSHNPTPAGTDVVVCGSGCVGFGAGPQQAEFDSIINKFVTALAGTTTPAVTANDIYKALADPARSVQMMAVLMPYVVADLTAILQLPQSQWTKQQSDFVQAVENYIQVQRQAAVQQALADYQVWAQQQVDDRTKLLYGPMVLSSVAMTASIASNQPVPPKDILTEAQLGLSMSGTQLTSFSALQTSGTSASGTGTAASGAAGVVGGTTSLATTTAAILGIGVTGTSEILSELPGATAILPFAGAPAVQTSDKTLALLTQKVGLLQQAAEQAAQAAKAADDVAKAAANTVTDAQAAAKAAQDAATALKNSQAVQEALQAAAKAAADRLATQKANDELFRIQSDKLAADQKAATTAKVSSSKAAELEKATSEASALKDAATKAASKAAAADEAVLKMTSVVKDLATKADAAYKAMLDAEDALASVQKTAGPLSKEVRAAKEALRAATEAAEKASKAEKAADVSLKLEKSIAGTAAKAADSAKAAEAAKAAEVGKLTSEVAEAEKAAKAAADAATKLATEEPQVLARYLKLSSESTESAAAAKDPAVLASLKELKAAEDDAKTAGYVARRVASETAEAVAEAEKVAAEVAKGVTVADDAVKAAVKAAKAVGVADEALKAVGVAEDILKVLRVGLTATEAVTAYIPVVGEIVAVVGDIIQIGMSVGAIAQASVFNKNLAAAADAAQKPVTINDLTAMAKSPTGQAQLLTYLTAMASTNGQPPPVDHPTMTLQQIITLSQSF